MNIKILTLGLVTILSSSSFLISGENLIKNGSFEDIEIVKKRKLYTIANLKDWNSSSAMRLWPNWKFGVATNGVYKLALDTNKGIIDTISQEVTTKKDALYQLCLDARARHNQSSNLKVLVDESEILIIHPSRNGWNEYCGTFVGNGEAQTITLSELDNEDNAKGPIVDNIRLEKIQDNVNLEENSTLSINEENSTNIEENLTIKEVRYNLIKNGSFENFEPIVVRRIYTVGKLENWVDEDGNLATMRLWPSYRFGESPDGEYKLALDTNRGKVDSISQIIVTENNKIYKMCIWGKKRKSRSSYFQIYIDGKVSIHGYAFSNWRKYCSTFIGKGGEQVVTIQEAASQDDGNGAMLDDLVIIETDKAMTKPEPINPEEADEKIQLKLAELSTDNYKTNWFEKAKAKYNATHPNSPYEFDYFSYQFPKDADFEEGTPPDNPISPKDWMQKAGLGFSKGLVFPYDFEADPYSDATIKTWKEKGFKNGRFHLDILSMVDYENDPYLYKLKPEYLEQLKKVLQRFIDNDMPVTISFNTGTTMKYERKETFRRYVEWWRQLAEALKNTSHLVAFENFVEYHGFDNVPLERRGFEVTLDNNETHYAGYRGYRNKAITNVVRNPGYNNLMAEISKAIRATSPTRIFLYKPIGIGRNAMTDITPWRYGPEGDYLKINNQKTPYWLVSVGGSANLRTQYIKSLRTKDLEEKARLANVTKYYTWFPAISYYNYTHIPVWVSLFGIKADIKPTLDYLGSDVTSEELAKYVSWYMYHLQNDAYDENGNNVKISAGFQQSWWIWDYKNHKWLDSNPRWGDNFWLVREALSEAAKKYEDFNNK